MKVAPAEDDRYELRGQIGEGGAGVVFRVLDRRRGREVALKRLRRDSGRDLFRFKREFRLLADLVHPNLVSLHELWSVDGDWMFTMELVDGAPFDRWVRPPGAGLDEARLRDALAQLTDGLTALHDAGKLHRDIKPSNVLVEPGGRVVLLDFGLVAEVADVDRTHEQAAVGTPAFMSPEQAADRPLAPASDWYAVGVMLYEALCGRRPFDGTPAQVMARKQSGDPPPPRSIDPTAPADLDALCVRLLDREPARRPDGRAVLAALGRAPSEATLGVARQAARGPFVGRDAELAALHDALAAAGGRSAVVVVRGASGIGKTALVRRFLDDVARDPDAIVLEGRCYEREAVPYKALDGVIDGLTGSLIALGWRPSPAALHDLPALLRLFPVLRRVPWLDLPALPGALPGDPAELRRRGLAALRDVLEELATGRPIVIAIDDLQWGDADGAAALTELVGGGDLDDGTRGLLVVATHRDEPDGPALAVLRARVADRLRELTIGALPDDDARALWSRLGGDDDDDAVRDAGGSPLLLAEIARARAAGAARVATVDDAVQARVARLDPDARALLDVVAIAGRPLRLAIAPRAASIGDADAALLALRAEQLVRVRGGEPVVEARHDRIRAAVVGAMDEPARRALHARLAEVLAADAPDPEVLIEHWLGAGDGPRAAALAEDAAARAEARLAFHRAADLLGLALVRADLPLARRRDLLARRGRALVAAGRLIEAAVELRGASALATGRERLALERLAVESLLKAGHLDRGLAAARALLDEVGERLPRHPVVTFAVERSRLRVRGLGFVPRAEAAIAPGALDRLDVLGSLASGLAFVEPVLGAALHARHLRRALDVGEPRRIAISLAQELGAVALAGAPASARVAAVLAHARAIATRLGEEDVAGIVEAGGGVGAYLAGDFRAALAALDAGHARISGHAADLGWLVDLTAFMRIAVLWWLGELRELTRWQAARVRAALDRGNVNARRHLSSWPGAVTSLVRGDAAEAHARIDEATPPLARGERFHLHHYHAIAGHTFADLYAGDGARAHARIEGAWRDAERAHVLRVQIDELEARFLRGAAAVAARGVAGAERAEAEAARIERHAVGHARALAASLRATAARARRDPRIEAAELEAALRHAERADLGAHAAAARWRLGALRGVDGAELTRAAEAWFRGQAVADPEAFARMLCP